MQAKEQEAQQAKEQQGAGSKGDLSGALPPGRPAVDVEAGPTDLCSCKPMPPDEAAAWLQERERRTAVHPKRHKW